VNAGSGKCSDTASAAADVLVRRLFDPSVEVLAGRPEDCVSELMPLERAFVEKAVASRQREFATGRVLARRLLAERGYRDFALLPDADRVPVWPVGIVGSISHTRGLCAVGVAAERDHAGLGLDVEPAAAVRAGLERRVCTDRELGWLEAASVDRGEEPGVLCRVVFSAKEAVYKAFYPHTRTFWDFHAVEVVIDLGRERFVASLPAGAGLAEIEGRVLRTRDWILSGVSLPPAEGR